MKKIRKFIVKQFALGCTFKLFGKQIRMLRCSRIMFPYFILWIFSQHYVPEYIFCLLTALWVFQLWIGFNWFGFGYFEIWPVKFEELDDEQKIQFGIIKANELTKEQLEELEKLNNK